MYFKGVSARWHFHQYTSKRGERGVGVNVCWEGGDKGSFQESDRGLDDTSSNTLQRGSRLVLFPASSPGSHPAFRRLQYEKRFRTARDEQLDD